MLTVIVMLVKGVARQNVSANSNPVPTFNVAGNASQAVSIAQATGNGQGWKYKQVLQQVLFKVTKQVQHHLQTVVQVQMLYQKPVCLMKELLFAAAMLALAGFTMIKHEHEE